MRRLVFPLTLFLSAYSSAQTVSTGSNPKVGAMIRQPCTCWRGCLRPFRTSTRARSSPDQEGILWKTIRRSAEPVEYLSDHSPKSQGTFNFEVTAMLKPLGALFSGSYHVGRGDQFAIGLEGRV